MSRHGRTKRLFSFFDKAIPVDFSGPIRQCWFDNVVSSDGAFAWSHACLNSACEEHIKRATKSAWRIGSANAKHLRLVGLQPSEHLKVVIALDEGLGFGHGRSISFCNFTAKKIMGFQVF